MKIFHLFHTCSCVHAKQSLHQQLQGNKVDAQSQMTDPKVDQHATYKADKSQQQGLEDKIT